MSQMSPEPTPYIYVNDRVMPRGQAVVSVLDHGFLYGDGCFESVAVTKGRLFMFDRHFDRMERSLRALFIDFQVDKERIARAISEVVFANGIEDSFVKVVVTRGVGIYPLLDPRGLTPTFVIFAERAAHLVDAEAERNGVTLKTTALRRTPPWAQDAKIKSLNYLNNILSKIEALESGADDALLLDENGEVAEATAYNVFVIHGDLVRTPSSPACLEGVTQYAVEMIAKDLDTPVRHERITLADVYSADEVFLTSTAGGVIPVGKVDGRRPRRGALGPRTRAFRDAYEAMLTDPDHSLDLHQYRPRAKTA